MFICCRTWFLIKKKKKKKILLTRVNVDVEGGTSFVITQPDLSKKLSSKILDVYWLRGKRFPLRFLDGCFQPGNR